MNKIFRTCLNLFIIALALSAFAGFCYAVYLDHARSKGKMDTEQTKAVQVLKESVESYYNPMTNTQVITTRYYVIAADGTYVNVPIGRFAILRPGQLFTSKEWSR